MVDTIQTLVADTASALAAAVCVSPFVVAVDKAIAENASGKVQLWTSFFGTVREMGTVINRKLRRAIKPRRPVKTLASRRLSY